MSNIFMQNKDVVLIIDDTVENHEVLQTFLSDIGVKYESAFDGVEAINMCSSVGNDHYSLILMDINLPLMDGIETSRRIRKMGITAPIIAVTAASKNEKKIKAAESEDIFDMFLFKPFNASAFYTTISPYIKSALLRPLSSNMTVRDEYDLSSVKNKICDVPKAVANMGNNTRLFVKHFNNFKTNNADLSIRLKNMIEKKQYREAAVLCHSIKGLSGMLGLTCLNKHIFCLERLLSRDNIDTLDKPLENPNISKLLVSLSNDMRLICQLQPSAMI